MSFREQYNTWKKEYKQHGPNAFNRFVMLYFLANLNKISQDFTFKGGNLLWHYIKTPRPTIDLDLSSAKEFEEEEVLKILLDVNKHCDGIEFRIKNHKSVQFSDTVGLKVFIEYHEVGKSNNQFHIDVVLGLATDLYKIKLHGVEINAASMENIICDKLSACHKHGSGSTRAKDYDDLYRIALETPEINVSRLKFLAEEHSITLNLNYDWLNDGDLNDVWKRFIETKTYKKNLLPKELSEVFDVVNDYLNSL